MAEHGEEALPPEVVAALRRGRKLEAIRLLREQRGDLDLLEAKDKVESYLASHPELRPMRRPQEDAGLSRLLLITAAVFTIIAAWRWLRSG